MFDFGFGELLLLGVIALVVLGPERLPVAARLAGRWIRKAREQWNSVKAELENELADEELRRELRETADAMRAGSQQVRDLHESIAAGAQQMTRTAPAAVSSPSPSPPDAPGDQADPGHALPGPRAASLSDHTPEPPDANG